MSECKLKEMTCIVCPNGCHLTVCEDEGSFFVEGNRCSRGAKFGMQEMIMPMRTLCSSVATTFEDVPVVPVRVSSEIPKSRIFECMQEINKVELRERLGAGDVVIKNILGLGADVILTSNVLRGEF